MLSRRASAIITTYRASLAQRKDDAGSVKLDPTAQPHARARRTTRRADISETCAYRTGLPFLANRSPKRDANIPRKIEICAAETDAGNSASGHPASPGFPARGRSTVRQQVLSLQCT